MDTFSVMTIFGDTRNPEIWMQKETGQLFITHPLFIKSENILEQIGFCIDDNESESFTMLNMDLYKRLNEKCELIGDFEEDASVNFSQGTLYYGV